MSANTDYFTHVGQPGTATSLAAPGHTSGGTSITVGSTANWSTDTGVIFAIDTVTLVNGKEVRDVGSYTEWEGVVTSGTVIGSLVLRYGNDQDYPAGSTTRVYIPVASSRENRLVDGLLMTHNQDGTMKSGITYPLPTIASFANANHTHADAAGGGPVNAGNLNNPYKFSVYRNAALTPATNAVITFDSTEFDTGSNVDVVTHKGRFTVPVTGFYWLYAQARFTVTGAVQNLEIYLLKNGSVNIKNGDGQINMYASGTSTVPAATVGGLVALTAGDYVEVVNGGNALALASLGVNNNYFQGFLVSKT